MLNENRRERQFLIFCDVCRKNKIVSKTFFTVVRISVKLKNGSMKTGLKLGLLSILLVVIFAACKNKNGGQTPPQSADTTQPVLIEEEVVVVTIDSISPDSSSATSPTQQPKQPVPQKNNKK